MVVRKLMLQPNQDVWYTADTHYNHSNLCRGTTKWDLTQHGGHLSVRPFDTIAEMNQAVVDGINKYVGKDDVLVHIGDVAFGGFDSIPEFMKRLICKNVIHVLGNHDHHIDRNRQGVQGYFMGVYGRLQLKVSRQVKGAHEKIGTYELCHFPLTIWDKAHHGRIHLHGHTHGSFVHTGRALDCGMDRAYDLFGEYKPFCTYDINKYMEGRKYLQHSHHNENTN
jgi:calcineurin-like phosphoesterase family protein